MRNEMNLLERPRRDLGADELWRRSLDRSRERRARLAQGEPKRRSLVSEQILDLDAPAELRVDADSDRDLTDAGMWDLSLALARAKRRAAVKGLLPQARVASASLVVAAVAALAPTQGGAHSRGSSGAGSAQVDTKLLKLGSRGAAVAAVQRALGIPADGVFGPKTRKAVRAFQARNGLAADGVVGPATRAALLGSANAGAQKLVRAWWVAPVQRALGIPADGVYGPQTRAAVRAYQAKHGLTVDGVVGPQTLAHLGITGGGGSNGARSADSGPASISRSLWDELALASRMGLRLISGHRPGASIGGNGSRSDHSYYPSRAIDIAGSASQMRRYALAVAGRSGVRYVIYSPLGMWGNWNGDWRPVSGGTRAAHYSHVHVSGSG